MEMADSDVREGGASAGEDEEVPAAETPYAPASDSGGDEMDHAGPGNSSASDYFRSESKGKRTTEDGVREDMFVDCADEIENSESHQSSEEKDNLHNEQSNELDSGIKVEDVVAEIEQLRDKFDKTVSEKEHLAKEYEEERAVLMKELSYLCNQLKVSNDQQIPAYENADGLVHHHQTEAVTWDAQAIASGASLHEMIGECSRLLKNAMDGRLQAEEKVQELHSVLYSKDQEISFLNEKVADLTESSNIANSEHDKLSQLYEIQLEKDRHIEEITNRILASVTTVHHQEEMYGTPAEKISNMEESVTFLVEKYNHFVSESSQLKECLNDVGLDLEKIDEIGTSVIARGKILELRRKEEDMHRNLRSLEDENRNLVEEIEKQKSTVENMNAEIGRLSAEVEQEKNRYANTKEKLSMAVTKGKALVQQRDSLKQSLLEKTSEFEKCSIALREKTSALDAAEKTKELAAASENLAASLQESLAEKEAVLQKCTEILSESFSEGDITEKVRWLVEENKSLQDISLHYHKLTDALLTFDFPETVVSSELDVCVRWLAQSFYLAKEEASKLQSEIAETKEATGKEIEHLITSLLAEMQDKYYFQEEIEEIRSKCESYETLQHELAEARIAVNNEIDRLTSSLLAESQEKSYLQLELQNLRVKYEGVVEKENLTSLEKNKIVSMLLEASGLVTDGQRDVGQENCDMTTVIDDCLAKVRDHACPTELSLADMEIFENFKSFLYTRDQEMTLYKLIIEEDTSDKAHVSHLSHDLEMKIQELNAIKDEKDAMRKTLDQLEERCALLKEKLSMAVKKGKGLVQERENLKGSLSDKNTEIDTLKSELQQYSSMYAECQDQVTKLLIDVERISLLEMDLISTKEHVDKLEQFLAESNGMLQRVTESIEGIITPIDLTFSEPAEKLKWIAGYLGENENLKTQMEQELRNAKDETSSLARKFSEVQATMKSLQDALLSAENSKSELLDKKKELDISKALLDEELQKEKEKTSSHTSKFEELFVTKKALEDALALAEDNVPRLTIERDVAIESRILAEEQLKELKEELSDHVTKLADADKTIQSLEDALSEAQKNISLAEDNVPRLTFEREVAIESRILAEEQIKELKEDLSDHVTKLADAEKTIQSLEDALSVAQRKVSLAEDNVSRLTIERDTAIESRILADEQIKKLKEELADHVSGLANADKTIQSLEDALSEAQKNISLLAEENSQVLFGRADLDGEMKRIREEAELASVTKKSLEDALLNAENNIADLIQEKKNAEQETIALTSEMGSCMEELAEARSTIQNQSLVLSRQFSRLQLLLEDATLSALLEQRFQKEIESLKSIDFLPKEMSDCFLEMDTDVLQKSPVMEYGSSLPSTLPLNSDIAPNLKVLHYEANAADTQNATVRIEKMVEGFHLKGKALTEKFDNLSTLMDDSIATLFRRLNVIKDKLLVAMKYINSLKDQLKDIKTEKKTQDDTIVSLESDIRILSSACSDATQELELNLHKNSSELRSIHELVHLDGILSMDLGAVEDGTATDQVKQADKLLLAIRQNQDLSKLFQDVISKLVNMTEDMQNKLKKTQLTCDAVLEERDACKDQISKLETDLIAQRNLYHEMAINLGECQEREDGLRKREAELSTSLLKVHEFEATLSASQVQAILDKINHVNIPDAALGLGDSHDSASVRKLFYVIDNFSESLKQVSVVSYENEELQSTIDQQILEIEQLKRQVEDYMDIEKNSEYPSKMSELESGLQIIVRKLGGSHLMDDSKVEGVKWLMPLLDKLVTTTIQESESLKIEIEVLGAKLLGAQKAMDDLSNKVKSLEKSNQVRAVLPEIDQERGTSFSSMSTQTEISEMQDMGALGKSNNIPSGSSAAHARTLRRGSSDHLAINIENESERFINDKRSDEDKRHVFKSLIRSGLIPRQGRTVADRIDGIWVSGSTALMNHPRGRLGLIAYWLVLHVWLLGTIL